MVDKSNDSDILFEKAFEEGKNTMKLQIMLLNLHGTIRKEYL